MLKKIIELVRRPYEFYQDVKIYRSLVEEHGDVGVKLSEYRGLVKRHGDLEGKLGLLEELPKMRERLLGMSSELESLKMTKEEMVATARINMPYNQDLEKWRSAEIDPLNKELKEYRKELDMLRGSVFSIAVKIALETNPKMQKVPFIYYDISNQDVIPTDGALEFLGIKSVSTRSSIGGMFDYLRREDKAEILNSLRKKERLRHHAARLNSEDSRELKLSIFYFDYNDKTIGAGISLYDSGVKDSVSRFKFVRNLRYVIRKASDQLKLAGENIRRDNRPYFGTAEDSSF